MIKAEVIESIYAAAAEPEGLQQIVQITKSVLDVDSAGLWLLKDGDIFDMVQSADIVESIPPYLAYYYQTDPWSAAPIVPNRISLGNELYDEDLLVRTEFYNDFARRFGMLRPMGATLDVGSGVFAKIATNRTEGRQLLGTNDKVRLAELSIHVRGTLRLRERLRTGEGYVKLMERSLDALAFGCIACEADGTVRYANVAALRWVAAGDLSLGSRRSSLAARNPKATARLRAVLQDAAAGRASGLRIPRADGSTLAVLATPLARDASAGVRGAVLLTISSDEASTLPSANMLTRLFDLSPAQAILANQLAEGLTFEAASQKRGISVSTARTHFLAILKKTGTSNLRDLLRLIATLPNTANS